VRSPAAGAPASVAINVGEWALRVLLALVFVAAGLDKFLGAMWVRVFNDIGFGQWFRYVTGIVEVLGGCLLLVPRATVVAVPVLLCTMAGALIVHLTVVGIGPQTVAVSVLVAALVVLWFLHRRLIPNP
jgi:putative oxidoreductase